MARRYAVLLVVLFVTLDAAAFLFLRYRMSVPPEPPVEFATPRPAPDVADDKESAIAGVLFLAGADDGSVLRMTRGECNGDDEDVTATAWVAPPDADAAEVPVPGGLVQAVAIGYDADGERWWVVGADADCAVSAWSGGLAGTSWEPLSEIPAEVWYPNPIDDTKLETPRGGLSLGSDCHATAAQVAGPYAYAVCDDGRVLETLRETREFSPLDIDAQVVAFAVREDERTAAVTTGTDCVARVRLMRSPDGVTTTDKCVSNTKAGIGVTWAGDTVVAQIGFGLMVDVDGDWVPRG